MGRFLVAGDGMRWYGGAFYPSKDTRYDMSHNTFIDIYRSSGIIPLLSYILLLFAPFYRRLSSLFVNIKLITSDIISSNILLAGLVFLIVMSLVSSSILAKPLNIFFLILFTSKLKFLYSVAIKSP